MAQSARLGERRTTVDDIFDHIHSEILSLRLRPGDKISEAEIAAQFGVSRQPVRDAFTRLATLDLLLIRPQRATEVKRFSMREITKSRFVRSAVDKEVLRRASQICDTEGAEALNEALEAQAQSIEKGDYDKFGALDYDFHKILCRIAKTDFAFDIIKQEKSKVDRLCILSLSNTAHLPELLADHREIADAVINHDEKRAVEAGTLHLSRLDDTIERISQTNANYFDPLEK